MSDPTQPRKGLCCLLNKFKLLFVRISECPNSEFGHTRNTGHGFG